MSVTAARGFRAAGVRAGLKASGKPDLALVVNDGPLDTAAGVFTTNRAVAAPVVWSRRLLAGHGRGEPGRARAVVLNSGSANACTGEQGLRDTEATAACAAGLLRTEPGQVLVCSTGVIGERIDMPVLLEGVDVAALALADTPQAGTDAATAIMTTDTVSKEDVLTVGTGEKGWTIGGMIKGVGMLAPGLATMLAVITTDAVLTPREAQDALASVTARTVNRINSDGCMSTNDTVLLEGVDVAALALADTSQAGTDAATAIMTTDTVSKEDAVAVGAGEQSWTIGGMIKGVGMLAPGLATMLAVITTDAVLTPQQAQDALASATMRTVNRINSDGCMSTNDTVVLLASGASGTTPSQDELDEALTEVMSRLGRRLVADAEGATHDIAITVSGAVSEEAAEAAARTVSSSNLLKCAVAGADPNWGRILSQLGTVPEDVCPFNPDEVDVAINGITIFSHGAPELNRDAVDMSPRETRIDIELSAGPAQATVWTNDLTHGYVTINADYTT